MMDWLSKYLCFSADNQARNLHVTLEHPSKEFLQVTQLHAYGQTYQGYREYYHNKIIIQKLFKRSEKF